MLVNVHHIPFGVRCPKIRRDVLTPEGHLNRDYVFSDGIKMSDVYGFLELPEPADLGVYEGNVNLESCLDGIMVDHIGTMGFLDPKGNDLGTEPRDRFRSRAWWARVVCSYGIADNMEQVYKHLTLFVNHPSRQFVLSIVRRRQADKDNFRWHKWGGYIGKKKIKHEHFADDKHIKEVLMFNLLEIKLP